MSRRCQFLEKYVFFWNVVKFSFFREKWSKTGSKNGPQSAPKGDPFGAPKSFDFGPLVACMNGTVSDWYQSENDLMVSDWLRGYCVLRQKSWPGVSMEFRNLPTQNYRKSLLGGGKSVQFTPKRSPSLQECSGTHQNTDFNIKHDHLRFRSQIEIVFFYKKKTICWRRTQDPFKVGQQAGA